MIQGHRLGLPPHELARNLAPRTAQATLLNPLSESQILEDITQDVSRCRDIGL